MITPMSDDETVVEDEDVVEDDVVEGGAPGYPAGGQTPDLDTNRPDAEGPIPVESTPPVDVEEEAYDDEE